MRHGKTVNHLGRTAPHRKALLANLASSLILNKRVETTLAKAKELRKYVEPLLTKAKNDTTHSRRTAFAYLQDKEVIKILFSEISEKIANRNGGYTRIVKLGTRLGDNAEMCFIELVDYNTLMVKEESESKSKTRRSRRGSGAAKASPPSTSTPIASAETASETPVDEVIEETPEAADEIVSESDATSVSSDETNSEENGDEPKEEK